MSGPINLEVTPLVAVDVPKPPPQVAPADVTAPVQESEELQAFKFEEKDQAIEDLRANIEFEIKRAGQPVDDLIEGWKYFAELKKKVEQEGMSTYTAFQKMRDEYSEVAMQLGEAKGYCASLAKSVLAFVLEKRGSIREDDRAIEDLLKDIKFEIKRAGQPVDDLIEGWKYFAELNKKVENGRMSTYTAFQKMGDKYSEVAMQLGEAKGYRASLATSVLAFTLETRRSK